VRPRIDFTLLEICWNILGSTAVEAPLTGATTDFTLRFVPLKESYGLLGSYGRRSGLSDGRFTGFPTGFATCGRSFPISFICSPVVLLTTVPGIEAFWAIAQPVSPVTAHTNPAVNSSRRMATPPKMGGIDNRKEVFPGAVYAVMCCPRQAVLFAARFSRPS
jgi:hypothetical protein